MMKGSDRKPAILRNAKWNQQFCQTKCKIERYTWKCGYTGVPGEQAARGEDTGHFAENHLISWHNIINVIIITNVIINSNMFSNQSSLPAVHLHAAVHDRGGGEAHRGLGRGLNYSSVYWVLYYIICIFIEIDNMEFGFLSRTIIHFSYLPTTTKKNNISNNHTNNNHNVVSDSHCDSKYFLPPGQLLFDCRMRWLLCSSPCIQCIV